MSLKKDNFSNKDKRFMNLALNLAKLRIGLTGTNPSVGCVIAKNNEIISIGQTSLSGRPHAEFNAIKNSQQDELIGSTMYVSLEPCSHFGKTSPCTNIIKKSKIKKVIYSINDVDVRTANKCDKILKKENIIVKKKLLFNESKKIYKSYFFNKSSDTPYITGKLACSKDNFIISKNKYITNQYSRDVSHLLRYHNQGILISSKTANFDNPKLNCRLNDLEKFSPTIFILDRQLKIKKNLHLFKHNLNLKKICIFYNKENKKKINFFKKKKIRLFKTKLNNNNELDLNIVTSKIKSYGINYLLVEGGNQLSLSFLKKKLFNEFILFKSNKNLKKNGALNTKLLITKLDKFFKKKETLNTYVGNDKIIKYF